MLLLRRLLCLRIGAEGQQLGVLRIIADHVAEFLVAGQAAEYRAGRLADRADQAAEAESLRVQLPLLLLLQLLLQLLLLLQLIQLLQLLELLQLLQLLRIELLLGTDAARWIGREWRQVAKEAAGCLTDARACVAAAKQVADVTANEATDRCAKHAAQAQALWCELLLAECLLIFVHGTCLQMVGRVDAG